MNEIYHQRVGFTLIIFVLSPFFLTGFLGRTLEEKEAAIIQEMVDNRFQSNSGAFIRAQQSRKDLEDIRAAYGAALKMGENTDSAKKAVEMGEANAASAEKNYEEAMAEQARTPQVVEEKKKKIRLEAEGEVRKIKNLFLEDLKVVKPNASPKEIEDIWIENLNQMLRGGGR